ncbi:hypothetical protein NQ314_006596 [Rhamnusium bicolor]|uniref:Uncharacterized protein n=1 Tax=Rhamnusium bicolor TaxID=1586634 RepID=A0AAV8Z283_9CUCU|nr:hypothetical protein NQ314_006596 [Rhamnusium bicolor]
MSPKYLIEHPNEIPQKKIKILQNIFVKEPPVEMKKHEEINFVEQEEKPLHIGIEAITPSELASQLDGNVEIPNLEINRNVYIELESRLERANQLLYQFEQIQNELVEMVGLDKLPEQLDERRAFENTFFETIAEAKDNKPAVSVGLSGVRLPQLNLPTFVGNYDTWLEFRDTFESLIHFNTTIGDIQKFHYLRASLDGSAKQVIHSLEFSEKNYKVAWDLLKRSYTEKRLAYISQKEAFVNELLTLKQGKLITKGRLSSLNPFLDKDEIIRVGGRLQLSEFPYEKMHPIVISAKHPFSKLLFRYEHENLCHAAAGIYHEKLSKSV